MLFILVKRDVEILTSMIKVRLILMEIKVLRGRRTDFI